MKNQAEIFWDDLFDCVIGDERGGDPWSVAREEYHATMIEAVPYDEIDTMTTWKFPDESIAFIIGKVGKLSYIILLPGMSIADHVRLCGEEPTDKVVNMN